MALWLLRLPLLWLRPPPSRRALASAAVALAAVPTAATAKVTAESVATAARPAPVKSAAVAPSNDRVTRPKSANPQDLSPDAAARHRLS